jgi:hypothetical protein
MANGLAEILSSRPFWVRLVNASYMERSLPKGMVICQDFPHPTGIVSIVEQEVDSVPPAKTVPKGLQIAISPERFAMGMKPTPLPDRPDVEGAIWKEEVELAHLIPKNVKLYLLC